MATVETSKSSTSTMDDPRLLVGQTLHDNANDAWFIAEKLSDRLDERDEFTGGNFSVGYRAIRKSDGQEGFVKVLDLHHPLKYISATAEAYAFVSNAMKAFDHEVQLLSTCREHRFRHVVLSIADGVYGCNNGVVQLVPFVVLTIADNDARRFAAMSRKIDSAWVFQVLHQSAVGLKELHSAGIVHRDIKPSNIMVFDRGDVIKIGDLGSAMARDVRSSAKPGGPGIIYAPPEHIYANNNSGDWREDRILGDYYMLGGTLVSMLFHISLNNELFSRVSDEVRPLKAVGKPYADVLPLLQESFGRVLEEIEKNMPDELQPYAQEIVDIIKTLCDPDPSRRGDVEHPTGNRMSLERYIAKFDHFAKRIRYSMRQHP